jgi:hypothetical protein
MTNNYDLSPDDVILLFKENPNSYHMIIKYRHSEFYRQIVDSQPGKTLAEKLYRYCYQIEPTCKTCGSTDVGFLEFSTGYRKYCSRYCTSHSEACKSGQLEYWQDSDRIFRAMKKTKETNIKRYGKPHWYQTEAGRKHVSQTSGRIIRERYYQPDLKRSQKQYTAAARHLTNRVYQEMIDLIDPERRRSMDWVVDHIFSIYDGYTNEVPLDVICHWTNLQIIQKSQNSSKGPRSSITLEELYERYRQTAPTSSTPSLDE